MFIGLIFSIIGLGVALIFLPLRLLRLAVSMVLAPVLLVVRLLTRNLFLVVVLGGIILLYQLFNGGGGSLPQLMPASSKARSQQGVPVVEPVLKKEDGDSQFATDVYATMTEPERASYSQNFYWAMGSLPNGEVHQWSNGNIAGSLRPNDSFSNSSGARCRHFNEVLKVHTIEQTISGTACEQGGGAWCKLKPNAAPACGLGGYQPGILDSLKNLF